MTHSINITSIDNQVPLLLQTEKYEIEEGRKVDHLINIKETNGQDLLGSQRKKFVNQIFEDLDNLSTKSSIIFKVNVWLRESNPDAYTPKMVSIGPYHNKKSQLHPMKKYKLLYLRRFLQRKEGLDVESCINEMEKLKEKALKCYDDIEDLYTDEFCQMLFLDGCFVVEFIRECHEIYPIGEDRIIKINVGYVFRDLLLLENQLPFFVLNKLHHMTKQDDELPLAILVSNSIPFLDDLPTMTPEFFKETAGFNIKHLLHVVHIRSCHGNSKKNSENKDSCGIKHLLHVVHMRPCHENYKRNSENKDDRTRHMVMPNATELSEAGVSFAKASNTNSNKDNITGLFDIKFENGLMTIPGFRVEDAGETLLRNLIAYEQQSCDVYPTYFSDYAFFMDNLIESDKDVNLLRQKGIIVNFIGEDKEVASIFNKIGGGVTVYTDFYYKEEFRKAVEYCEKPWHRMKANLMHNYFSTPWVGASTVAAIILLILTTIQTILSFTGPIKK